MSTPVVRQHLPSADRVKEHAQHTAQEARPWVVRLGRFCHAAHGAWFTGATMCTRTPADVVVAPELSLATAVSV